MHMCKYYRENPSLPSFYMYKSPGITSLQKAVATQAYSSSTSDLRISELQNWLFNQTACNARFVLIQPQLLYSRKYFDVFGKCEGVGDILINKP